MLNGGKGFICQAGILDIKIWKSLIGKDRIYHFDIITLYSTYTYKAKQIFPESGDSIG